MMGIGEGLFYFIWGLIWFVVASDLHKICVGKLEKVSNWLAAIFLAFGPW